MNMETNVKDGLHEFSDQPQGIVFLGITTVQILQRKTGRQITLTLRKMQDDGFIPDHKMKRIEDALLVDGIYSDNQYQIMGVQERT